MFDFLDSRLLTSFPFPAPTPRPLYPSLIPLRLLILRVESRVYPQAGISSKVRFSRTHWSFVVFSLPGPLDLLPSVQTDVRPPCVRAELI